MMLSIHRFDLRFRWLFVLSIFLATQIATDVSAARFRPIRVTRKPDKIEVAYPVNDPKEFYRAMTLTLEKQPPDNSMTITARAVLADVLFQSRHYREAAQIYLQLMEAPLADQYKLSSFQYRLAECYFQLGLYNEAYDQFSRVRKQGHRALQAEATLGLAMAALGQGNNASAQSHLDLLLLENEYYKTYSRALYPAGLMLFQNDQYQRAQSFFEKDLTDPKNIYFAGLTARRLSQIPKALSHFQNLTQKFPGTVWAERGAFEVSETYYQQKDYQLSYQSFQRWLKEFPRGDLEQEAKFRLASADMRREQYRDVVQRLEPMLAENLPPSLEDKARLLYIESLIELDNVDQVVDQIKKRGSNRDRTPDENYQLTWALASADKHLEALVAAEEALKTSFDAELTPKTLLLQGYSYDKLGRGAEALASYQTVLDRFPKSFFAARALHFMALSYMKAQRWQEVVTQVNHSWSDIPADLRTKVPEVEFWITEAQLSLGSYDAAERRYQRFLANAPENDLIPYAYLGLAVAQAQNKKLEIGYQTLQQFATLAKNKKRPDWLALATMQSGNIYFNQKKYDQAVTYYRSLQKEFPKDTAIPQAMYQEGQSLYRLEYYTDAVGIWQKLVNQYPQDSLAERAQFQIGRTLFDLGKTAEAVKAFETFIDKYPNSDRLKEARLQLANAYYNADKCKEAIPLYQSFLALYPKADEVPTVEEFLQTCYVKTGKTEQELEALTQGKSKSNVLANLYWEKGAQAFNAKDYPTALSYFEKLMISFPASNVAPQASFYRAEGLAQQQKHEDAAAAYKTFVAQYPQDPNVPTALFHWGASLFALNRFEEAAQTFEALVRQYPNDPNADSAAQNIPIAYNKMGRVAEAEKALKNLMQGADAEKKAGLLIQLGQTRERASDNAGAIKYYEQVDPSRAAYPEAIYAIGNIHALDNQTEKEIKVYEKLLTHSDTSNAYRMAALSRLAELYIAQGAAQKALSTYQDVAAHSKDAATTSNAQTRIADIQNALKGP